MESVSYTHLDVYKRQIIYKRAGEYMSLSFRKWREMALTDYPVVSDKDYKKVYENIATDPQTGESILVQLTLQGVLDKCEGTNFEEPIRKCIMKCVYTVSYTHLSEHTMDVCMRQSFSQE